MGNLYFCPQTAITREANISSYYDEISYCVKNEKVIYVQKIHVTSFCLCYVYILIYRNADIPRGGSALFVSTNAKVRQFRLKVHFSMYD